MLPCSGGYYGSWFCICILVLVLKKGISHSGQTDFVIFLMRRMDGLFDTIIWRLFVYTIDQIACVHMF